MAVACQAACLDALEDLRIWRAFDIKKSHRAFLQPAEAVIDENVSSRDLSLEFHYCRSACRDKS